MKNWMVILILALAGGVWGQGGMLLVGGAAAPPPPAQLLLDEYPGAAAAYSLRKLRAGYTGNCIQVRRSDTNALADIGFVNNYLDTVGLKAFCPVGVSCYVHTWYDQAGSARHVVQTAFTSQPQIVNQGTIIRFNNKVTIYFDGSNDILKKTGLPNINPPVTTFTVHTYQNITAPVTFPYVYDHGIDDMILDDEINTGLNIRIYNGTALISNIGSINVQYSTYALFNTTSSVLSVNNTTVTGATGNRTGESISIGGRGSDASGAFFSGNMQEFITYFIDMSSNQSSIRQNINSFYSIY